MSLHDVSHQESANGEERPSHDAQGGLNGSAVATTPKRPGVNVDTLQRFLPYVIVDSATGGNEVCLLSARKEFLQGRKNQYVYRPTEFNSTYCGYFNRESIPAIIREVVLTRGVSAYVCFNPVSDDYVGRSENAISKLRNRTKDEEIAFLRWWYIDVDAVKPSGVSATDEQLAATVEARDKILADHPDIRRCSLFGKSGNGSWIAVRLPDLPNDADHETLVADAFASIAATYSCPTAKIDSTTKNAARLGCLPGTMKCKGTDRPRQPWRLATLDGEPEGCDPQNVPTLDLRKWLTCNPPPPVQVPITRTVSTPPSHHWAPWQDAAHIEERARKCVFAMNDSVAGESGHKQLYAVAVTLVDGFGLDRHAAQRIFGDWNAAKARPPESDRQVQHKLDDAIRNHPVPSLRLLNAQRDDWRASQWDGRPQEPRGGPSGEPATTPDPVAPRMLPAPAAPMARPPLLIEPIKARAAHHVTNGRIEDLYRDDDFMRDLARLERENVGEAEAIKWQIGRVDGFKAKAFNAVLAEARKATKGGRHGGNPGGGGPAGGTPVPPFDPATFGSGELPEDFDPTDMGNAAIFLADHGHHARYVKAYGAWLVYDGTRWKIDHENIAVRWAQTVPARIGDYDTDEMDDETAEAVRTWQSRSKNRDRLRAILDVAMAPVTMVPEDFDKDIMVFNCANGTIDLDTMEFRPHDPRDYFTKISPVPYDPDARCPLWDAFVLRVMGGDSETVRYVRRIMGYSMTGDVKDHSFFIFHGGGGNGKGTLINQCVYILGNYAIDIDPEVILSQANAMHPTGLTDLEGRRLVIADETDEKRGFAEALVKRLTGGSRIRARKIGQDYYDFPPTHHLVISTNNEPEIKGDDQGIWRRLRLIPFNVTFDKDGVKGEKPDLDLPEKLRAESPGILNWLLAGLADWKANGLDDCPTVRQATDKLRSESDRLGTYLAERAIDVRGEAEANPRLRTLFGLVYEDYKDWTDRENIKPVSKQKLGRLLNDRGFRTEQEANQKYKVGLLVKINGLDPRTLPGANYGNPGEGGPPEGSGSPNILPMPRQTRDGRAAAAGDSDVWEADRE